VEERAPGSQVVSLLVQHSGGGQVHHLQDGKSGPGEDQPQHVLNTAERNFFTLDSHSGRGGKEV